MFLLLSFHPQLMYNYYTVVSSAIEIMGLCIVNCVNTSVLYTYTCTCTTHIHMLYPYPYLQMYSVRMSLSMFCNHRVDFYLVHMLIDLVEIDSNWILHFAPICVTYIIVDVLRRGQPLCKCACCVYAACVLGFCLHFGKFNFLKIPSKLCCNIFYEMENKIWIFSSILFVLISVDIRYIIEFVNEEETMVNFSIKYFQ